MRRSPLPLVRCTISPKYRHKIVSPPLLGLRSCFTSTQASSRLAIEPPSSTNLHLVNATSHYSSGNYQALGTSTQPGCPLHHNGWTPRASLNAARKTRAMVMGWPCAPPLCKVARLAKVTERSWLQASYLHTVYPRPREDGASLPILPGFHSYAPHFAAPTQLRLTHDLPTEPRSRRDRLACFPDSHRAWTITHSPSPDYITWRLWQLAAAPTRLLYPTSRRGVSPLLHIATIPQLKYWILLLSIVTWTRAKKNFQYSL